MMRLACASPLAPCALILLFTFLCLAATPSARGLAVSQFKSVPVHPAIETLAYINKYYLSIHRTSKAWATTLDTALGFMR